MTLADKWIIIFKEAVLCGGGFFISDPVNPVHAGKIKDGDGGAELSDARMVWVKGDYAYVVARGGNALEVINISDPANPVHAAKLANGGF